MEFIIKSELLLVIWFLLVSPILVLYFFFYPWIRLLISVNKVLIVSFGRQALYFNQESLVTERQLLIFRSNPSPLCQISDIQNVQAIPGEGVVIQIGNQRYTFGSELTAHEGYWLVEEIQKWLKFSAPVSFSKERSSARG